MSGMDIGTHSLRKYSSGNQPIHRFTDSPAQRLTPHVSTSRSPARRERAGVRGDRGFTLIELIIVVALIGIVAAIATPQFIQMLPGMRVNAATREVMTEMLLVKMKAVSENRKYRVKFTPAGNQYIVQQDANRNGNWDASDPDIQTGSLPAGIVFATDAAKATDGDPMCDDAVCFGTDNASSFLPSGTVDAGSVYLIPQVDKGTGRTDRMRAVSVDTTGRVKAWRYKGGSGNPWESF